MRTRIDAGNSSGERVHPRGELDAQASAAAAVEKSTKADERERGWCGHEPKLILRQRAGEAFDRCRLESTDTERLHDRAVPISGGAGDAGAEGASRE